MALQPLRRAATIRGVSRESTDTGYREELVELLEHAGLLPLDEAAKHCLIPHEKESGLLVD
jgi:hypothetical protein